MNNEMIKLAWMLVLAGMVLGEMVGAQSSQQKVQDCVKTFAKQAGRVSTPSAIKKVAKWVLGHDRTRSLSILAILSNPSIEIDFKQLVREKDRPQFSLAAKKFLDNALKPSLPPEDCFLSEEFLLELDEIENNPKHKYHAKIGKVLNYSDLCRAIIRAFEP